MTREELVAAYKAEQRDFRGVDLSRIDLKGIYLRDVKLNFADISNTDLSDADLIGADLEGANLEYASLAGANLGGTDLSDADLSYADIRWCIGNAREIRSMQLDRYMIAFTKDQLAIGCKQYPINKWRSFTDREICEMDNGGIAWWSKWKEHILKTIELSF
jgi:hypothetical protein